MACRAGHVYSVAQFDQQIQAPEVRERSLALGPDVIAKELIDVLEKRDKDREP